jgi:hypothetical protein
MNNSNIQPIRTTLVHIRSKDCTEINGDKNSNFVFNLNEDISVSENDECHISVTSAEMPYSFYNISSDIGNDTLVYEKADTTFETLVLTNQNYNINQLITKLNSITSFTDCYTATYDTQKMKITITNNTITNKTIKFSDSNMNKVIGWNEEQTDLIIAPSASITSTGVINLATIHSLLIHSNISTGNVVSTKSMGNSTILQKVSVDTNSGYIIYLNNNDFRQITVTNQQSISNIEITITDQNRQDINFNSINLEMSLQFAIFPRYVDRTERRSVIQAPQPRSSPTQLENINRPDGQSIEPLVDSTIIGKTDDDHREDRLVLDDLIDSIST